MATDRELRDRLEALQVEVRETRKALTEARRLLTAERTQFATRLAEKEQIIAGLSEQLDTAQVQASTLEALVAAHQAVSSGPSPLEGDVEVVALAKVPEDLDDTLRLLTSATGLSKLDLTLRLRVEPPVPLVRLARVRAQALAAALRENGVPVVTCDVRPPQKHEARRLALSAQALRIETRRRNVLEIGPGSLKLVVLGRRSETKSHTELERVPDALDGGSVLKEVEVREELTDSFIWLYAVPEVRIAVGSSTRLEGFDLPRVQPVLQKQRDVATQLKAWAPAARLDDRLVRLARFQAPLLGQHSHVLLAELLWASIVDAS